jgi:type IV secretory pathway VirJ component
MIAAIALMFAMRVLERPALGGSSNQMAVMISGDGGWRPIDVHVTEPLRKAGIPVVGIASNEYFHQRRTPEEAAADLAAVIRTYQQRWNKPRVILIGFSRGADVMPFLVNRLPAEVRSSVDVVALIGLESTIDWKYHPSWIPFYHPHEPQSPVQPEVEKMRGLRMLCIFGSGEKTSLCRTLDPSLIASLQLSGGHHLGGHYAEAAAAILRAATMTTP